MAFFSSVLSRLTDPGGENTAKDTGGSDSQNLTCRDEVDDFLLVSQSEENSQGRNTAQMLPPTYQQVTQADNESAMRPTSVSLAAASFEDVKKSPLDGVPFALWYGHSAAVQSASLAQYRDSAFGHRCTPEDILNRYNYTFETERSVLHELGDISDDFYQGTPYIADTENHDPVSQASSDMTSGCGFSSQPSARPSRASPEVGCLVDLS